MPSSTLSESNQNRVLAYLRQSYDPSAFRPAAAANPLAKYQRNPVGYAREVLGLDPWAVQRKIARLLLKPPYRVLVKSSHSVGKTWTGAWLTSWWYDCFDPSAVITTAPTARDVRDLLWREIRLQRHHRGGMVGATAPEMRSGPDHHAKGFTAATGESFQGRHPDRLLLVFDEAVGIAPIFWETAESMFKPDGRHGWVCFFNPTDTSSQAYQEEQKGGWHVVTMSSVEHPNLLAQLKGKPAPYPSAVSLGQFEGWLKKWCDPVEEDEHVLTDLEWPPKSGKWYRPGPQMESRALGRWPSSATYGVWSESLLATLTERREILPEWKTVIGCDVARFGDDLTAIFVRRGLCLVHAEAHNGWAPPRTATRLKQLCLKYQGPAANHRHVQVNVDVDGIGAGVVDLADDFNFVGVSAAAASAFPERYKGLRSELWCSAADLAREGLIDATRLKPDLARELGRQLLAPVYEVPAGRIRVEEKAETKKRLRCSPDLADAFNLCYYCPPKMADSL